MPVQSVDKALQLLDLLAAERRPISLTELSQRTGWPKSTLHGLLSTLRGRGYIDQAPDTGLYRLGARFNALSGT